MMVTNLCVARGVRDSPHPSLKLCYWPTTSYPPFLTLRPRPPRPTFHNLRSSDPLPSVWTWAVFPPLCLSDELWLDYKYLKFSLVVC